MQVIMMLPVGSVAVGEDFVNRENEVKIIMSALKKDNILVCAPRKYGKTSVMRKVQTLLRGEWSTAIFIDVHDVNTPQEFLIELATGAFDKAKDKRSFIERMKIFFSNIVKNMEFELSVWESKIKFKRSLREEIEKSDWKEEGRTALAAIRDYFGDPVYLIIDEFSECVHNMYKKDNEKAEVFLKWFRSMRAREDNLKFIIGGSVSIDRVVRKVTALSSINDFRRVTLRGFDKETTFSTVRKVFDEEKWGYTNEIGEKIVECIGVPSVPYFLSAFLSVIQEESAGKDLDERCIEDIYNSHFMGASGKYYFDYYVQRLTWYYEEEMAARAILKELYNNNKISKKTAFDIFKKVTNKDYELFLDLMSDLENDFYLEQIHDSIRSYSKPLADWWRLYHV
jgi:hypothetical protein